jgi:predicted nucleotidyltransferase
MADHQTVPFGPPSVDDPGLQEIVRRLVDLYRPDRIYLFGSTARGEAGPDSDYDIMVVMPDDAPPELCRTKDVYQVLRGIDASIDVLVWKRVDFDARLHLKASFPSTIAREGKLLYAA